MSIECQLLVCSARMQVEKKKGEAKMNQLRQQMQSQEEEHEQALIAQKKKQQIAMQELEDRLGQVQKAKTK